MSHKTDWGWGYRCGFEKVYLEKFPYAFYEEQYFYTDWLKEQLKKYAAENKVDDSTKKLMQFLDKRDKKHLRFDEYYAFYVSKEKYRNFLYYVLPENRDKDVTLSSWGCGGKWWCILGCGSDHGCCGNYDGCCLYANFFCWIHDKQCTRCNPSWYCLPGCIPDKIPDGPWNTEL